MDPSHPENLATIHHQMRRLRSWGFDVIKHDFSTWDLLGRWGPAMGTSITNDGWAFYDRSRTTAEVVLGLYRAIRNGCGSAASVISCNGISHLSAGIFDYYRIGDDSAGNLEKAVKFGVNSLAYRLPQQGTFYTIDPDCVSTNAPWEFERKFINLVAASNALFQLSARLESMSTEQLNALRAAFTEIASNKANNDLEPVDWLSGKQAPNKWLVQGKLYEVDWDDAPGPGSQRPFNREPRFSQAQIEPCHRD
jgi:alpha-galactosidase